MTIPFVDLKIQYQSIKKQIDTAISEVITNTRFIQGKEVSLFEKEFAQFLGAGYCIGVNSGTDALIVGIRALGLHPQDEVIIPVNTFIATALGVSENKLKPVFVDMDPEDYGMDLADIRRKITSKTKAILPVHLFGQPEKIDEINKIIKQSGQKIYLIEDACQAHGAIYKGKKVGSMGVFSAFSFYPGKNLGAYGDGGAIVTNDAKLARAYHMLREYGSKVKYVHETVGTNTRLDTIQAAILRVKLQYLEKWNKKRQQHAALYTTLLHKELPNIKTPPHIFGRESVFHLYVIEVDKRDELLAYLSSHGVQALIHYPIPLHMQKAFADLGYKKGDFPNAEKSSKRMVSLPMFPELTREQITYIVGTMKDFYGR